MKILLVQTSFLGDVVLSTPVVGALRAEFPEAEIWMLTTPLAKALIDRTPELAGVLTFDKACQFRGPINRLRDHYLVRRRRAVIKHRLPESLAERVCPGLRVNYQEQET